MRQCSGGLSSFSMCRSILELANREPRAGQGSRQIPNPPQLFLPLRVLRGRRGKEQPGPEAAGFSHFYCKALGRANYNGIGHLDSSANERNRGERKERGITTVSCSRLRTERVTRESIVLTAPGENQAQGPKASPHREMHHTLSSTTLARGIALDIGHHLKNSGGTLLCHRISPLEKLHLHVHKTVQKTRHHKQGNEISYK